MRAMVVVSLSLGCLLSPVTVQALSFTLTHEYADPNPVPDNDYFGSTVAFQGDTILIGADTYDPLGAVVKFGLSSPALIQTIYNPSTERSAAFADAMAPVGANLAVGNPDERIIGSDGVRRAVGQTYLFDANGNLLHTLLHPNPESGGALGASVADLSGNVLVGAPNDSRIVYDEFGTEYGPLRTGRVYLFDSATGSVVRSYDCPGLYSDRPVACGRFIAVYNGNVLVGDTAKHRVYLLDAATGDLLHTFDNPNPADPFSTFGGPIVVVGQNILIGDANATVEDAAGNSVIRAGRAYLFNGTTGALLRDFRDPTPQSSSQFGGSMAAYGDDVLIGAAFKNAVDASGIVTGNSTGVVYLFDSDMGAVLWTFQNPAPDPLPDGRDRFGFAIAVSGTKVLISADSSGADAGTAYLYSGVSTLYSYGGVEQPINADGSSIFKLGRTLPVKFGLTDIATGQAAATAIATLEVAKVSNSVLGTYEEAVSTSAADDGNQFRYAGNGGYIFNLSTKPLNVGTYRLRISLDDGQSFTVDISLR